MLNLKSFQFLYLVTYDIFCLQSLISNCKVYFEFKVRIKLINRGWIWKVIHILCWDEFKKFILNTYNNKIEFIFTFVSWPERAIMLFFYLPFFLLFLFFFSLFVQHHQGLPTASLTIWRIVCSCRFCWATSRTDFDRNSEILARILVLIATNRNRHIKTRIRARISEFLSKSVLEVAQQNLQEQTILQMVSEAVGSCM